MNYSISEEKLLSELTVGEFARMMDERMNAAKGRDGEGCREERPGREYVQGIRGIMDLFGVSRATAQKYKDGVLKPAVLQRGRKILVDKEKALELFGIGKSGEPGCPGKGGAR